MMEGRKKVRYKHKERINEERKCIYINKIEEKGKGRTRPREKEK